MHNIDSVCVCASAHVHTKSLSCVQLFVTLWTVAHQAPLSVGFFQARVLEWGAIAFSSSVFYAYFNYACPPGWSGDESVQLLSDG